MMGAIPKVRNIARKKCKQEYGQVSSKRRSFFFTSLVIHFLNLSVINSIVFMCNVKISFRLVEYQ